MKAATVIFLTAVMLFMGGALWAEAPDLQKGVYIQNGAVPLEVSYCSVPTAVDWNNDGAKDLVIGQFSYGYIWLYLNQGTDMNPIFNGGSLIQSGGAPITTSYS